MQENFYTHKLKIICVACTVFLLHKLDLDKLGNSQLAPVTQKAWIPSSSLITHHKSVLKTQLISPSILQQLLNHFLCTCDTHGPSKIRFLSSHLFVCLLHILCVHACTCVCRRTCICMLMCVQEHIHVCTHGCGSWEIKSVLSLSAI